MAKKGKGRIKGEARLAGWQRALLWGVWLGVAAFILAHSDRGYFTLREFAVMGAGIALTVWVRSNPAGAPTVRVTSADALAGEFYVPTSWPLLVVGGFLALGGVAMGIRLTGDLHEGTTTLSGALGDMAWFLVLSTRRFNFRDVTRETHLYILVWLLPIGLIMAWVAARGLRSRARPFRLVENRVEIREGNNWSRLPFDEYARARVEVGELWLEQGGPTLRLPLDGVYSVANGTMVDAALLTERLAATLERHGFEAQGAGRWTRP